MKVARRHRREEAQGQRQRVTAGYSGLQWVMAGYGYGYGYGYVLVRFTQLAFRAELYLWLWLGSVCFCLLFRLLTFAFVCCTPKNVCQRFFASLFCSFSCAFRSQIKYFHAGISFSDFHSGLLQVRVHQIFNIWWNSKGFHQQIPHVYRVCGKSSIQPQALGQLTFCLRTQRLSQGCGQAKFNAAWFINVNDHIDLYVRHVWHSHIVLLLPHVTNSSLTIATTAAAASPPLCSPHSNRSNTRLANQFSLSNYQLLFYYHHSTVAASLSSIAPPSVRQI